jgi:hypothetical protein
MIDSPAGYDEARVRDRVRRAVIALGDEAALAQQVDGHAWVPLAAPPPLADVTGRCPRCGEADWRFTPDAEAACARCANRAPL